YSSCRQYLEDIERARESVGPDAPRVEKLRAFYNHPGFIEANVANIRAALERIPEERRARAQIVFTAHSIPESMAKNCDYEAQLRETSRLISERLGIKDWQLVFQSRSGPPTQPWLEPDVCDHLRELQAAGATDVVVAPVGFVSDHMEIIYDLDTQARALCEELGLNMIRAATAGTHPAFIEMIRELIMERVDPETPQRYLGAEGPHSSFCGPGCCSLT
ncbi:MAG TPA: ferrochelatase, partial [Pyrinomonadaceae bacterium]